MKPRLMLLALMSLSLSGAAQLQPPSQRSDQEQFILGTEEIPGQPRVKHPVPVPDLVLRILMTDNGVVSCLAHNPLAPGKNLGSWFIASEIHLDGPDEADLIVVPSFRGKESMCFGGATGIGLFWIFRKTAEHYQLALKTWGGGLEILSTRSSGYRDVQTGTLSQAGRYLTTVNFQFDGKRYQKYKEATKERQ